MIKNLAHVCLSSKDLQATERFYCNALGLKKAYNFIRGGRVVGFYLDVAEGSYVEVFKHDKINADENPLIRHFCLEVDDMDHVARRLAEHGHQATQKVLGPDQSWQMWTTDPNGVKIEFHQYTDRSHQLTRKDCILK